eukprot:875908-Prymnesium_polylepis.1
MRRESANASRTCPNLSRMRRELSRIRCKSAQTETVENFRESGANLRISAQNHCEFGANARRCDVTPPVSTATGISGGELEEVAAPAAPAAVKRPGAPSDELARDGQHTQRDDDARRAVRRRGDDAAAAAAATAAAGRAERQRSNRQQRKPASEP